MWDVVIEFKQTNASYTGRFAPSPTGPLHVGSLSVALGSWLLARQANGRWLIRVEDVDRPREVPGAARSQLATLAAFGLESDGPVVRQRERGDLYRQALNHLLARGDAFTCACSRRVLGGPGGIHRACIAPDGHAAARQSIRLRVRDDTAVGFVDQLQGGYQQQLDRAVGDFVLRRSDGLWAYQLAVVVDDAEQGVTAVVRGADLLDSTPRQILLQQALQLPTPDYLHLGVLVGMDGCKLSKSRGAAAVDSDDPLPAMRLAWAALGQEPKVLNGRLTMREALSIALRQFDQAQLPACRQLVLAALHKGKSAGDV